MYIVFAYPLYKNGKEGDFFVQAHYSNTPIGLLQHAVVPVCGDGRFAVPDDVAQDRLGIASQHRKFPAPSQIRIGKLQREIGQHDAPKTRIIHFDDEAARFKLRIVVQILAGLNDAAGNTGAGNDREEKQSYESYLPESFD